MKKFLALLMAIMVAFTPIMMTTVAFSEEFNDETHITTEIVTPTPEPTATPEPTPAPNRRINLKSSLDGKDQVMVGTEVTLTVELIEFLEEDSYTVMWQRSTDKSNWETVETGTSLTYKFDISEADAGVWYRAVVILN